MNVVNEYGEKRNGFTEVVAFCHVTCRYFDRFLLQGVDRNWRQACFFYLAPGLICEVYWQVNSRRSIFRIADPIILSIFFCNGLLCLPRFLLNYTATITGRAEAIMLIKLSIILFSNSHNFAYYSHQLYLLFPKLCLV